MLQEIQPQESTMSNRNELLQEWKKLKNKRTKRAKALWRRIVKKVHTETQIKYLWNKTHATGDCFYKIELCIRLLAVSPNTKVFEAALRSINGKKPSARKTVTPTHKHFQHPT